MRTRISDKPLKTAYEGMPFTELNAKIADYTASLPVKIKEAFASAAAKPKDKLSVNLSLYVSQKEIESTKAFKLLDAFCQKAGYRLKTKDMEDTGYANCQNMGSIMDPALISVNPFEKYRFTKRQKINNLIFSLFKNAL